MFNYSDDDGVQCNSSRQFFPHHLELLTRFFMIKKVLDNWRSASARPSHFLIFHGKSLAWSPPTSPAFNSTRQNVLGFLSRCSKRVRPLFTSSTIYLFVKSIDLLPSLDIFQTASWNQLINVKRQIWAINYEEKELRLEGILLKEEEEEKSFVLNSIFIRKCASREISEISCARAGGEQYEQEPN